MEVGINGLRVKGSLLNTGATVFVISRNWARRLSFRNVGRLGRDVKTANGCTNSEVVGCVNTEMQVSCGAIVAPLEFVVAANSSHNLTLGLG